MRRRLLIGAGAALAVAAGFGTTRLVSDGADEAATAAADSVVTQTFTNENVVTYTVPTVTETVTVPAATEPPVTTTEPPPTTTEPPLPEGHVISPGDDLNAAISAGHPLILLRGGSWGSWSRSNDSSRASYVTVESYPGEVAVFSNVTLRGVQRLRVKGIRNTGTTGLEDGSRFVELLDSEFRGRIRLQRSGTPNSSDLTIRGNWIHDFGHDGTSGSIAGYGIISASGLNERMTITDNVIENLSGGDGIQFASTVRDTLIENNTIRNIQGAFGSHSDVIQIVASAERLTIRGGAYLDSAHPIRIAPSQTSATLKDVLVEGILVDGIDNVAIQLSNGNGGPNVNCVLRDSTFRNYAMAPTIRDGWATSNNTFEG